MYVYGTHNVCCTQNVCMYMVHTMYAIHTTYAVHTMYAIHTMCMYVIRPMYSIRYTQCVLYAQCTHNVCDTLYILYMTPECTLCVGYLLCDDWEHSLNMHCVCMYQNVPSLVPFS